MLKLSRNLVLVFKNKMLNKDGANGLALVLIKASMTLAEPELSKLKGRRLMN